MGVSRLIRKESHNCEECGKRAYNPYYVRVEPLRRNLVTVTTHIFCEACLRQSFHKSQKREVQYQFVDFKKENDEEKR